MSELYVGRPINRIDGPRKVMGQAKYAAEFPHPDLLEGVVVSSPVTKGRIVRIGTEAARAVPGVVEIVTHENRPSVSSFNKRYEDEVAAPGHHFRPLYDERIRFAGQPVALVVAESFEAARAAALLVEVECEPEAHETDIESKLDEAYVPEKKRSGFEMPKPRGDGERAWAASEVKIDSRYSTPVEHHNPMETHASTVFWNGDGKFTIFDKTQGVVNCQQYLCHVFGLKEDDVRVLSPFVGGAFGSGLRPQYQLVLAMMASMLLERSVRVVLTRQQTFTLGHRPQTLQHVKLGASKDGKLTAICHTAVAETSSYEDYMEVVVNWSGLAYQCSDVHLDYKITRLDLPTPSDMRAPGASLGLYALESAMDELADSLGLDPVTLRMINYAERDQAHADRPFSSKELKECYKQGAERFGWEKRDPRPRSMRRGHKLIGWGMATGIWDAFHQKASARATISADGMLTVATAGSDIGTGTYTILAQVAADAFGHPIERIRVVIGDSQLPPAPVEGGSWLASTLSAAVHAACEKLTETIASRRRKLDLGPETPAHEVVRAAGLEKIEETITTNPQALLKMQFARNTHSAVFVEVAVDEDLGMVEVTRVVSAIAAGRILNPKTARSQIIGGVVWGAGMALHEKSEIDHAYGRFMTHNLADYHIPAMRDIGEIDVLFVKEEDEVVSPLGVKGLGEIGIVGTAAAVANAIFHATGKRVRDLPITPDKLID